MKYQYKLKLGVLFLGRRGEGDEAYKRGIGINLNISLYDRQFLKIISYELYNLDFLLFFIYNFMAYFYTRWVSLYLLFLLFFFSPGTLLTRLIRVECTLFRNISSSLILATNPCSYSADNIFNANSSSAFSTYFCSIAYIWACRA